MTMLYKDCNRATGAPVSIRTGRQVYSLYQSTVRYTKQPQTIDAVRSLRLYLHGTCNKLATINHNKTLKFQRIECVATH